MWSALSFQDSVSPSMEHVMSFHDHAMIILALIIVVTLYLMVSIASTKNFDKYVMESQEVETVWTILPGLMLVFIAVPSLSTLYFMEDSKNSFLLVKVVGHQWYWSYEYLGLEKVELDSFMASSKVARLLKTDSFFKVPCKTSLRLLVSSSDVIHSWAVPSMGVKVDALPGRLNQAFILIKRVGLFAGQCSEICGMNHSFMPIFVKSSSIEKFLGEA